MALSISSSFVLSSPGCVPIILFFIFIASSLSPISCWIISVFFSSSCTSATFSSSSYLFCSFSITLSFFSGLRSGMYLTWDCGYIPAIAVCLSSCSEFLSFIGSYSILITDFLLLLSIVVIDLWLEVTADSKRRVAVGGFLLQSKVFFGNNCPIIKLVLCIHHVKLH